MARQFCGDLTIEPEYCPESLLEWHNFGSENKKSNAKNKSSLTLRAKKHLSYLGWFFKFVSKKNKLRELRYIAPDGKIFASLRTACEYCFEKGESERKTKKNLIKEVSSEPVSNGGRKRKSPSADQSPIILPEKKTREKVLRAVTSHTSVPQKESGGAKDDCRTRKSRQVAKTKISWLIESKVVPENAQVQYVHGACMKRGRITRDGIWCNCCNKKFGLQGFEVHAGSKYRRPAACTFLEDGRSLLQCNMEASQTITDCNKSDSLCSICHEGGDLLLEASQTITDCNKSDSLCSICHEGGDLLLCHRCPSAFHLNCVGVEEIPNGKWFCPSCKCGICGKSEFNENKEEFTENTTSVCDQCHHEFHMGCLRRMGCKKLKACTPQGNWFCSKKCEKIFVGLHEILGKSIQVENSEDNLSWTILRYSSYESYTDTMMEFHAKLNVALGIMHESFKPIHEPFTNSDLIEDVIFSKGSELKRLNFRGFYTVLLEREDDVICVATLRVHGEKVAEMPFIATPAPHRRKGMCSLLMDAIEKKLVELGVQKLILPAVGETLNTWIDHFGFSKMMDSDRKKYLSYTFLDFQKSTICQKLLTRNYSSKRDQAMLGGGAIPSTNCVDFSLVE